MNSQIELKRTQDVNELSKCLRNVLYVPKEHLRGNIVKSITDYIAEKGKNEDFVIEPIIAYSSGSAIGFVNCVINPHYRTYGRKALTFGWLSYDRFETCKALMNEVERIAKKYRYRRIRGNINFPKGMGGIGFQTEGFSEPLLYGVAFNAPNIDFIGDLERLGYTYESEYCCLHVDAENWEKGAMVDERIEFRYYTFEQFYALTDEIKKLGKESFQGILPDTTTGIERIREVISSQARLPTSTLRGDIDFYEFTDNPTFIDAWKRCDLTKINFTSPMAFDKRKNKLVGIILSVPNIYEEWDGGWGEKEIEVSVDTAMVHPEYKGMGIFSALNNIGQLTYTFYRPIDIEGTYIWSNSSKGINNREAINSIFPHCSLTRKHIVTEKRIRMS